MKRAPALLLGVGLVVVGGLLAVLLGGSGGTDPALVSESTPRADGTEGRRTPPPTPTGRERVETPTRPATERPPEQPTVPAPEVVDPQPDETTGVATVVVQARDGTPIPGFRVTQQRADGGVVELEAASRTARWTYSGPPGTPVVVVFEAEGWRPSEPLELLPREVALPPTVVVLEPDRRGTGVTLTVLDPVRAPVTSIEVTASRLDPAKVDSPATQLWRRRAVAGDGVFELPELPAGRIRLDVQALGDDGRPAPLLPWTKTLDYFGSEDVRPVAELAAGAMLELDVVDGGRGAPPGTEVALRLVLADGRTEAWTWHARVNGELLARRGGLPGAARTWSAVPLPPGRHVLELQRGDAAVVRQEFVASPRQWTRLRVTLP